MATFNFNLIEDSVVVDPSNSSKVRAELMRKFAHPRSKSSNDDSDDDLQIIGGKEENDLV
jgi:hypothetical protein